MRAKAMDDRRRVPARDPELVVGRADEEDRAVDLLHRDDGRWIVRGCRVVELPRVRKSVTAERPGRSGAAWVGTDGRVARHTADDAVDEARIVHAEQQRRLASA